MLPRAAQKATLRGAPRPSPPARYYHPSDPSLYQPTASTSREVIISAAPTSRGGHGSPRFAPRESLRFALQEDNKPDAKDTSSAEATASSETDPSADSASPSGPFSSLSSTSSSDPSSDTSSSLVIQTQPFPTPPSSSAFVVPRVPFSTHRFVRQIEKTGIKRDMAEDVMTVTKKLLLKHEEMAGEELLSRAGLENEAYLFTAALSELKTESQVKSRNDGITLRSMTSALQRESDAVSQKMKEDIQRLTSDIQLDMNTRKEETSGDLKGLDMKVMDLNSKFTILLGEVRTEIEATKWISTRRVMSAIVVVVVAVIAVASSSSASAKHEPTPAPPTIEELGLKRAGEEADVGGSDASQVGTGWFWSSPNPTSGQTGVKKDHHQRVEGEGDGDS